VTHTLVDGTREEVQEEVKRAVGGTEGGGFILAPAHTHASINAQSLSWRRQGILTRKDGRLYEHLATVVLI